MPILNYTTQIAAEKTITEIQKKLARAGASAVLSEYDSDGVLNALSFRLEHNGQQVYFRLPAQIEKIYVLLQRQGVSRKLRTMEQASRVSWRIIKDWIEAQLALVEADQAEMIEVFLPYAQNPNTGNTLYHDAKDSGFAMLEYQAG